MPNSANRMSRKARSGKMKAGHLMRYVWAKQLALKRFHAASKHNNQDHERRESRPIPTDHSSHRADGSQQPSRSVGVGPRHSDTAEKLAEAIPSATGSTSATIPSLAPVTSSTTPSLPPPDNPWKKVHEELRVMKVGEPGRLALLASTYSSAESRSRLTKPGEPEMTWEEVKAAVRESPPLKRKFNSDVEDDTENPPRPAKMSRFEERTARVNVYDLPRNIFTTYHPTKPRRKRALPMDDDEEELHLRKKRCCDKLVSIFEPRGRPFTGDSISQILKPIEVPPFDDTKSDESPHQEPKKAKCSVPLNCQMPSVVPKPEVENSLRPAQDVTSKISVPSIKESTPSVPKVQLQTAERSPTKPTVTNATEPASQPNDGSKVSNPKSTSPSSTAAKNSNRQGDFTRLFFKSTQNSRDRALGYLRFARTRASVDRDQRLVRKMTDSQRLSLELHLTKPTDTRPQTRSSLHNDDDSSSSKNKVVDDKKVPSSPSPSPSPDSTGDQKIQQPSHNKTVDVEKKKKKILQSRKEARRRAGFWTAEMELVQQAESKAWEAGFKKEEKEVLIKMRKRILRTLPGKKSPLRISESVSKSESGP